MVAVEISLMERERTCKRPRLAWDVAPPPPSEVQRALPVSGDEGFQRKHVSPPRRDDDREGHYVFNLGKNLTPRCIFFFGHYDGVCLPVFGLGSMDLKIQIYLDLSFFSIFFNAIGVNWLS